MYLVYKQTTQTMSVLFSLAFSFVVLPRPSPAIQAAGFCSRRTIRSEMMAPDDAELDMALLARRMAEIRTQPIRLLVLDSMVPRQRLSFHAPAPLVEMIRREVAAGGMIGMAGRQRLDVFSHGVLVDATIGDDEQDGGAQVVFTAGRLFQIKELGDDEGSRWLGRRAEVQWASVDAGEEHDGDIIARSAQLSLLVRNSTFRLMPKFSCRDDIVVMCSLVSKILRQILRHV